MSKLPKDHPLNDPISGNRFAALCEGSWADDKRNGRERPPASGLLYLKSENVLPFFELLDRCDPDEQYVILSTNSDLAVDSDGDLCNIFHFRRGDDGKRRRVPRQVRKWFACNLVSAPTDRVRHLPLGLCNGTDWGAGCVNEWKRAAAAPRRIKNQVLCCFSTPTNPAARESCRNFFVDKPWATVLGGKTELDLAPQDFAAAMRTHEYIVSPVGNGPDCHRVFESWMVSSTPVILMSNPMAKFYFDLLSNAGGNILPICAPENWETVERLVEHAREPFNPCDHERLLFSWWAEEILFEASKL